MTKRLSNKAVPRSLRAVGNIQDRLTPSTVSLSSAGQRFRTYRWRYLQLIKDGLIWLTGKRTRAARASESRRSLDDLGAVSASRPKKQIKKILRFKGVPSRRSKQPAKKTKGRKVHRTGSRSKALTGRGKGSKNKSVSRWKSRVKVTGAKRSSAKGRPKNSLRGGRPKSKRSLAATSASSRKRGATGQSKRNAKVTGRGQRRRPKDSLSQRRSRVSTSLKHSGNRVMIKREGFKPTFAAYDEPGPSFTQDGPKPSFTHDGPKPGATLCVSPFPSQMYDGHARPTLTQDRSKLRLAFDGPKRTMGPGSGPKRSQPPCGPKRSQTKSGPKRSVTRAGPKRSVTQTGRRSSGGQAGGGWCRVTRSVSRRDLRKRCQAVARQGHRTPRPILIN